MAENNTIELIKCMILCILIYTPLLVSYDYCKLGPLLLANEVCFASWSVQMFFFQFLKTSRFPLNLIHKKRYLKFSLLNLWPLKFCLKYLHDVWTFLKFKHETASAPSPPPSLCYPLNPLTLKSDQHVISPYHIRSISPLNQTLKSWE